MTKIKLITQTLVRRPFEVIIYNSDDDGVGAVPTTIGP